MQSVEDICLRADEGGFAVGMAGGGEPDVVVGEGGLLRVSCEDGVRVVGGEAGVVVSEKVGYIGLGGGVGREDGALWGGLSVREERCGC